MKTFKRITAFLLALVVMLPMALEVYATDPSTNNNVYEKKYLDQLEINYDLQLQILDLQNKINELNQQPASTPRPQVYAPKVKLLSPQTVNMDGKDSLEVTITVKNIGTSTATSLLTQAVPAADAPLTAEFLNNSNTVNSITDNSVKDMTLRITADKNAEPGTYAINLTHAYKNKNSDNLTETDTLYVRITGAPKTPSLILRDFRIDKATVTPGEAFTLTASLENAGDGEARGVQTAIEGLDADKLYLTSDLNTAYYPTMAAKYTGTVHFTFMTTTRAKNGAYPLTFNITYKDEAGKEQKSTYTYYVNVLSGESEGKPILEIRDLNAPGGLTTVDQNAQISFQVFNNGTTPANHIKITAIPSDETALVPKSANIQQINSLPAETGKVVSFSFAPTASAKTRSYVVGFRVEYETGSEKADGTAETVTFEQYASVNVSNPEEEKESETGAKFNKPKMIVSEYSVDPQIVRAGREFDLHLTFQNASGLKSVNNIKVTLTAIETTERKGSVFTPVGGSNTFYIDEIGPKGEVDQSLRMYAVPDADPRTYNIAVNFSYQDEDFNDYEEHEQISINVKQITRIETSEPYIPELVPAFQQVSFGFNVINSGRVSLSNLRIRIDGNFDTSNADQYVGNLGKGNSIYCDGFFTAMEVGQQDGAIVVYGEDDTGEIVEYSRPFSINVYEMTYDEGMMDGGMVMDGRPMPGMEGAEEPTTVWGKVLDFIKKPYFWGPAAGLAVLIVVIVVVRIRRKNKRIDFDE